MHRHTLSSCLRLAGAPCDFLPDSCEGACVDDCRVVILDIVFVPFAVVCLDPLADAVGHISVIYTVHMESGKKLLGYDRETAYFSKTVAKERNTAQRFLCPLCRICDVSVMDRYLFLIFDYLTECLFLLSNTVTPVRLSLIHI